MKTIALQMTPAEVTTGGFMKVQLKDSKATLKFKMDEDFRGRLVALEWWVNDEIHHRLDSADPEFENFRQVGERPEVEVPGSWLFGLGLESRTLLRVKMIFDTFRQDAVWYGYLFWLSPGGDSAADSKAPYLVDVAEVDD